MLLNFRDFSCDLRAFFLTKGKQTICFEKNRAIHQENPPEFQ